MSTKQCIDTLVIGAGQAGIAMSEHLARLNIPHVVLERNRVAEQWQTGRWDSLVANGPAWHDRFPGMEFADIDPDAFVPKDQVAQYFRAYAQMIHAPIRTGVLVESVTRNPGHFGFIVKTSGGNWEAKRVVAATGPFQKPIVLPLIPPDGDIDQIHSSQYRNPAQLRDGAVLVVGAGSSGVQIADELARSGRKVYLSLAEHDRPPRRYRGRDYDWWLGVLGLWDVAPTPGTAHVTIAVSGAYGGHTIDFRDIATRGVTLLGRTKSFDHGILHVEPDLGRNLAAGDDNYLSLLKAADEYVDRYGLDLPVELNAHKIPDDPPCVVNPILKLDLAQAGIHAIVWATGFTTDFQWLHVDAFDARGKPQHTRGVSVEPGVYFLGLPGLSCRGSSFIWGVWHDAKFIADHIAKQRRYFAYNEAASRRDDTHVVHATAPHRTHPAANHVNVTGAQ